MSQSVMHGAVKLQRKGLSGKVVFSASWALLQHCPTPLAKLSPSINPSLSSTPSSLCQSHCSSSAHPPHPSRHLVPVSHSPQACLFLSVFLFFLNSFKSSLSLSFLFLVLSTMAHVSSFFLFFYLFIFIYHTAWLVQLYMFSAAISNCFSLC